MDAQARCVACGGMLNGTFVRTSAFRLVCCSVCGSLTAVPRPTVETLTQHHDSHQYFAHPYFQRRRGDVRRGEQRAREVFERVRAACPGFAPAGRHHLDVGCDTGTFLEAFAKLYNTVPTGVDIAERPLAFARARGLTVHHTDLEHATDIGHFDLITFIDVLEHVPHPVTTLKEVAARLRPGGVCYLETPNIRSTVYATGGLLSKLTGGRPAWVCERLFLPEHVQYFSAAGLEAAAATAGLRVSALTHRPLGRGDINSSLPVIAGVQALQLCDRLFGREILHCAVLTW